MGDVLIVIDVQRCFLQGGTLGGPFTPESKFKNGPQFASAINTLIMTNKFSDVYMTKDVHSANHSSFMSEYDLDETNPENMTATLRATGTTYKLIHVTLPSPPMTLKIVLNRYGDSVQPREWEGGGKDQVLWPDHCVGASQEPHNNATDEGAGIIGSTKVRGASLAYDLAKYEQGKKPSSITSNIHIVEKGFEKGIDSYSAIADALGNETPHITYTNGIKAESTISLANDLRAKKPKNIYICGIARDFCVYWTAMDILDFLTLQRDNTEVQKLHFLYDLTKEITPSQTPDTIYRTVKKLAELRDKSMSDHFVIEDGIAEEDFSNVPASTSGGRRRRKTHRKSHSRRKTQRAHRHGHRVCHKKNCRSSR
jgi:nicotinamidase-related amidase